MGVLLSQLQLQPAVSTKVKAIFTNLKTVMYPVSSSSVALRLITGCIPNLRGDFVSLVELYLHV